MFSLRQILKLSGVKAFPDETLGEVYRCTKHSTNTIASLRVIFLGRHPFFHCPLCGHSLDAITMVARSTHRTLDAAAQLMMEHGAFMGTKIDHYLATAKLKERIMLFHESNRAAYEEELRANRLLAQPLEERPSLIYDRSLTNLTDVREEFPEFRSKIRLKVGEVKTIYFQLAYNAAGAPGRMDVITPLGNIVHSVYLDHQSPSNHFYLTTPEKTTKRNWKKHLMVFNDQETAAGLWDWVSEWATEHQHIAVAAVASRVGESDKADIDRVTVVPVGAQSAWASTGFSARFSDMRVKRLPAHPRRLSAKEQFERIAHRERWSGLTNVLDDFSKLSIQLIEEKKLSHFRDLVMETMQQNSLTLSEKRMAVDKLHHRIPATQRETLDQILDEVCVSRNLDLGDTTYLASHRGYTKLSHAGGTEVNLTDFRTLVLAHVHTNEFRRRPRNSPGMSGSTRGGVCLALQTQRGDSNSPVVSSISEKDFNIGTKLMATIRSDMMKAGLQPANLLTSKLSEKRLLPQIIEGTQASPPELIQFPCLGFDRETNSYNYPEVSFKSDGNVRRQITRRSLVEHLRTRFMLPPGSHMGQTIKHINNSQGEPGRWDTLSLVAGIGVWFAFRAARSERFRIMIRDKGLVPMLSRFAGMGVVTAEDLQDVDSCPLFTGNIPMIISGISATSASAWFNYSILETKEDQVGGYSLVVENQVEPTRDEIQSCPQSSFRFFAEAALRVTSTEEAVEMLFSSCPMEFRNLVNLRINDLASGVGVGRLDQLLDFIRENRPRYVQAHTEPGMIRINTSAIGDLFGEEAHGLRIRLFGEMRERVPADQYRTVRTVTQDGGRMRVWIVPESVLDADEDDNIIEFATQ